MVNHFRPSATHIPPFKVRSLSERMPRTVRAGAAPGQAPQRHIRTRDGVQRQSAVPGPTLGVPFLGGSLQCLFGTWFLHLSHMTLGYGAPAWFRRWMGCNIRRYLAVENK